MANDSRRLADDFWDLRDDAYDHPARWREVTADALFQKMAERVEAAEERGGPIDWRADVVAPLIAWRAASED